MFASIICFCFFFFFFQAEDGIRDLYVTGVQTCALPILNRSAASAFVSSVLPTPVGPKNMNEPVGRFGSCRPARARRTAVATARTASRSEERRVGKECRSRGSPYH